MPFSIRRMSKISLLALGLVLIITLSAVAVGFRTLTRATTVTTAPVPAQDLPKKAPIPTIFTTLTRFGFQPAAMKLPEGKCFIAVRNISGADDLEIALIASKGEKLVSEKPKKGKSIWEKEVNLKAGNYTLSVVENPRWTLALTVLPPDKK